MIGLKIKGYKLIETIPYSAKDRVIAFWVRQVGRPNIRAFTYIGKRAKRMVAIYVRSAKNPVCIDCGSWIPWEEAVQVRLDSKRAYVCQGCFRSYAYRNPTIFETLFGKPKGLYEQFHGASPNLVKIKYKMPDKPLVKIGRLLEVTYLPELPSKRTGTAYTHKWGDTGSMTLPGKPILAVDKSGKNFYILKSSSRAKFSERGIVG